MKFRKQFLTNLNRCYSATSLKVGDETRVLLASEGASPCLAWTAPDYAEPQTVWEAPGGTMSMVPIPGTDGEFLAIQNFLRMFECDDAKIVHVRPLATGGYAITDVLTLPYIHRFDILTVGDRRYFIGCTLSTGKATREDWSNPGQIWVGEYTGVGPLDVKVLKGGLTKNHGYSRLERNGVVSALVTCDEGAFEVTPPATPGAQWSVTQLMDWPISDIAAIDIDGDGELEYATIEDLHGPYFRVYKKVDGGFKRVFEHPEISEFYHVVVGTMLAGRPVFIGGCRRGKQQLFYVHAVKAAPLELAAVVIEEGVGPSNVHVLREGGREIIVSANREKGEAALYFVE
jgi:hypothetical protein